MLYLLWTQEGAALLQKPTADQRNTVSVRPRLQSLNPHRPRHRAAPRAEPAQTGAGASAAGQSREETVTGFSLTSPRHGALLTWSPPCEL
uniref:Uncharacterized protein n=1 Tax=Knipowitschia caucasica TaxID=637954 RepID=A0AAV2JA12_KNICA